MVIQEDEADDLLESVDRTLKELRYGDLSQLLVEASMPSRVLNILVENFEIEEDVVVRTAGRMGYGDWSALAKLHHPRLKDKPFSPRALWPDEGGEAIFNAIQERDRLVHHPFESFSAVESFLRAAVDDAQVIGIKITLYRIGPNSPLLDLLIQAADAGKQVAVLVELKARFDERNNIEWAHQLEAAGIHVVYGLLNLKTHCKLCLVVRQEHDGIVRYAHVGTGNYNRVTSQVYTDFGIFTARPAVLDEVTEVFNYLTGYSSKEDYEELLVAPQHLRPAFTGLVEREAAHARAGRQSGIIFKNNSVADPEMIRVLYRASQAGVPIEMIVRGVCCLRPGIPGISDTIRVRSVVGRFLEHSRLYYFANNGRPELLIGSADLMERNLDRRVEALCHVRDPELRTHPARRRPAGDARRHRPRHGTANRRLLPARPRQTARPADQRAGEAAAGVHEPATAGLSRPPRSGRAYPIRAGTASLVRSAHYESVQSRSRPPAWRKTPKGAPAMSPHSSHRQDPDSSSPPARVRSPEGLGRLARRERKRQGLTLDNVYSVTGLTTRFLSEFERGKPNASLGRVMQALQALGLEMLILPRGDAERLLARQDRSGSGPDAGNAA